MALADQVRPAQVNSESKMTCSLPSLAAMLTTLATRDSRMNNNTTTGYRCSNHEHDSCLIISKSSIKQVAIAIAAVLAAYIMQVIFIIVTQGKCQSLKKRSLQVIE